MDTPSPPDRPPGIDPLIVPPSADHPTARSQPVTGRARTEEPRRDDRHRPPRKHHPASGARAIALTTSIVATGAVAAALAYSEGAWSADDTAAGASSVEPATSPVVADSAAATTVATIGTATSDTTPDDAQTTSNIPSSSSSAPTTTQTTPETTQPADTAAQASGYADGVHMGTAEYTEWGDVQVQVTIRDGAIIEIEALEYPTGRRSSAINNEAIPMLEAEAIAWQTADLDVVSGATYTSWTYAASLQAALDQAALAATQEADTA